jgi:hypothetical protein
MQYKDNRTSSAISAGVNGFPIVYIPNGSPPSVKLTPAQNNPMATPSPYAYSRSRVQYYKSTDFFNQSADWILTRYLSAEAYAIKKGLALGTKFIKGTKSIRDSTMLECIPANPRKKLRMPKLSNDKKQYMIGHSGKIQRRGNKVIRFYVDPIYVRWHAQLVEFREGYPWVHAKTKYTPIKQLNVVRNAHSQIINHIGAAAYLFKILADWCIINGRRELGNKLSKMRRKLRREIALTCFRRLYDFLCIVLRTKPEDRDSVIYTKIGALQKVFDDHKHFMRSRRKRTTISRSTRLPVWTGGTIKEYN